MNYKAEMERIWNTPGCVMANHVCGWLPEPPRLKPVRGKRYFMKGQRTQRIETCLITERTHSNCAYERRQKNEHQ